MDWPERADYFKNVITGAAQMDGAILTFVTFFEFVSLFESDTFFFLVLSLF